MILSTQQPLSSGKLFFIMSKEEIRRLQKWGEAKQHTSIDYDDALLLSDIDNVLAQMRDDL